MHQIPLLNSHSSPSHLPLRKRSIRKLFLCIVPCAALSSAWTQTLWNNPDLVNGGAWNVPGNWSPGLPTSGTETQINNGGRAILSGGSAATRGFIIGDITSGNRLEVLGANLVTRGVTLGNVAGGSGAALVGSGSNWSTDGAGALSAFNVGLGGSGSLLIETGATLHSGRSRIAINAGSSGEATVRGTWIWEHDQSLGLGAGAGVLNLGAGGKISLTGVTQTLTIGAISTFNIGGSATPEAAGRLDAATVNGTGAAPTLNFNHTNSNYIFETESNTPIVISGTTRVNHLAGTTTLTAANTYTGATQISGGSLFVNGSLSGSSAVTVSTAGTLGGTGSVGSVTIQGTLAPGNSIGTLSVTDLNLSAASTLSIELGRDGSLAVSDRVNVSAGVSLTEGANLELTLYTGYSAPDANDLFFLVNKTGAGTVSGEFTRLNGIETNLSEGSIFTWNSQQFQITYLANFSTQSFTGGNDIALFTLTAIPEPSGLGIFGLAIAIYCCRRRANVVES